ncbi:hypothetical protein ACP70R_044366 [Stipagrostis hirtigluma subsp. patula]
MDSTRRAIPTTASFIETSPNGDMLVKMEVRIPAPTMPRGPSAQQTFSSSTGQKRRRDGSRVGAGHCCVDDCPFVGGMPLMIEHMCNVHGWALSTIKIGEPFHLIVTSGETKRFFVADDSSVFLLTTTSMGSFSALTLVCVCNNAIAGAGTYWLKMQAGEATVASRSPGLAVIASPIPFVPDMEGTPSGRQCLYLVVPARLKHDVTGEFVVSIRVTKE